MKGNTKNGLPQKQQIILTQLRMGLTQYLFTKTLSSTTYLTRFTKYYEARRRHRIIEDVKEDDKEREKNMIKSLKVIETFGTKSKQE